MESNTHTISVSHKRSCLLGNVHMTQNLLELSVYHKETEGRNSYRKSRFRIGSRLEMEMAFLLTRALNFVTKDLTATVQLSSSNLYISISKRKTGRVAAISVRFWFNKGINKTWEVSCKIVYHNIQLLKQSEHQPYRLNYII